MRELLNRYKTHIGIFSAFMVGFAAACLLRPTPASAQFDLDDILGKGVKIVGVKILIDQFGGDLNKFINNFLDNNSAPNKSSSKVVTIISPIGNKHIGAAQVTGPKAAVEKVGAVVALETAFMNKQFRIKAMVPIEGTDATDIDRVAGVGVSAIIDIKL
jgi:hypothetical protein